MSRKVWTVVTLAVPLVLIAGNIRLLASATYLRWAYGRSGFPTAPGFSDAERLAAAVPSTRFIVSNADPAVLAGLRHRGAPLYGRDEIDHLVDVRSLVRRLSVVSLIGVTVIIVAALAAWPDRARRRAWRQALGRGGVLAVGLVLAVGAGIAVAWPLVFTGFHELLFPPGTWQFPLDSGLIRLFPGEFWYDVALVFSLLTLAEGLVLALAGRGAGARS